MKVYRYWNFALTPSIIPQPAVKLNEGQKDAAKKGFISGGTKGAVSGVVKESINQDLNNAPNNPPNKELTNGDIGKSMWPDKTPLGMMKTAWNSNKNSNDLKDWANDNLNKDKGWSQVNNNNNRPNNYIQK